MKDLQIALVAISSIILFIFGLENFSKEINKITGEKFRTFLGRVTSSTPIGVLLGAVVTAVIQSSSATSVIAIGLVNAGVLSFKNSVGIIFGSNIGTTVTAHLIAFKLTNFAPVLIIAGFLLTLTKSKFKVPAKALFYFGFVFFSLNLVSSSLAPLKDDPRIIAYLTGPQNILISLLAGMLITALIQSSSVTTGLAVILTQQGILNIENAIPILMGANIGTTATAMLSIINMDISAKKTACAHFLFNIGGVLFFLPIFYILKPKLGLLNGNSSLALANFHLVFNISTTILFVALKNPFVRLIDWFFGEGHMDFERIDLNYLKEEIEFEDLRERLFSTEEKLFLFIEENYSLVTLSIEANYKSILETAKKRIDYIDFVRTEFVNFYSLVISKLEKESEVKKAIEIINQYEYLFQIHDSIKDIVSIKGSFDSSFIEIKSDLLLNLRELSGSSLSFFEFVNNDLKTNMNKAVVKKQASELQSDINDFNKSILKLIAKTKREDAGLMIHIVTHSQRLKDKIYSYYVLKHQQLSRQKIQREEK